MRRIAKRDVEGNVDLSAGIGQSHTHHYRLSLRAVPPHRVEWRDGGSATQGTTPGLGVGGGTAAILAQATTSGTATTAKNLNVQIPTR
jgi:hypothetical protein